MSALHYAFFLLSSFQLLLGMRPTSGPCNRLEILTPCEDSFPMCFPADLLCNGFRDCRNGSDERDCNGRQNCPRPRAPCRRNVSKCIFNALVCNGVYECTDLSDEEYCNTNAINTTCPEAECPGARGTCLTSVQFCDGVYDCPGGADELANECANSTRMSHTTTPELANPDCPNGTMVSPCEDYLPGCINQSLICNLMADCPNAMDESVEMFHCTDHELLPFGEAVGDTLGSQGRVNEAVGPIKLPAPIIFYQRQERSLFISTNGVISFRAGFTELMIRPFPRKLPLSPSQSLLPLIAPLWSDFHSGSVFYRVVTNADESMLEEISELISTRNLNFENFLARAGIIVTWFNSNTAPGPSQISNIRVTFQAVLMTDGISSFVSFIYVDPEDIVRNQDNVQVGFDGGDGENGIILLPNHQHRSPSHQPQQSNELLQAINSFRIDGACLTAISAGSACGLEAEAVRCDTAMAINSTATSCQCRRPGFFYKFSTAICEDVDECEMRPCDVNATCTNIHGSFECVCNTTGFTGDGIACEDIDECDNMDHGCDHICTNTVGSFFCSCSAGYILEQDGRSCQDVDECDESEPCGSKAICTNTLGSFECKCDQFHEGNPPISNCTVSHTIKAASGMVGVVFILFLVVVISIIIVCLRVRKRRKQERLTDLNSLEEIGPTRQTNEYFHNLRNITVRSSFNLDVPKSLIISSCNLQIGKTIGQGEFGIVYKGLLKRSFSESFSQTVAVKTLKGFLQKELVSDLLKECAKMYKFDHPNVLTLTGVCLDGGPAPYIIMPFMAHGSLLSYLKQERQNLVVESNNASDDVSAVQSKLLDMCIQVAKGMEYLASKRVIHRDLAARNCMIDVNFVIKVADFGLSESIDSSKDYFRQDQTDAIKLPVKWLAPESIADGIFSEKSDVWSYGVTCWEVFSGGKTPYPGVHPLELPRQLETGFRMEKPLNDACSDEIYLLIMKCWDKTVEYRPSFSQLVSSLSSYLECMADYLDVFTINNPNAAFDITPPPSAATLADHTMPLPSAPPLNATPPSESLDATPPLNDMPPSSYISPHPSLPILLSDPPTTHPSNDTPTYPQPYKLDADGSSSDSSDGGIL